MRDSPFSRARRGFEERAGISLTGAVSVGAVLAVLVVVSLPRLRGLARSENEADARATVELLARELARLEHAEADAASIRALCDGDLVTRALSDAEYLADGQLLRRHGYLFRLVPVAGALAPPPEPGSVQAADGAPCHAVRAWPWEAGRTGRAALLGTCDGRVYRHANDRLGWTGPEQATPHASWDGWRPLP